MQCGIGHFGHCQLARRSCARTARFSAATGSSRGRMQRAVTAGTSPARRLEVRLLRWLPAEPARLRGRAADARGHGRDRALPGGVERGRGRPYDVSIVEGSITTAPRRRAHPARSAPSRGADHHRRLRDRRRDPGAAQLRRRRRLHRPSSTRTPNTSPRWDLDPDRDHVPVDFELRGCPVNKRQLLEVIGALLHGRKPTSRPTASAWSASGAAPCASWSPRHPLPRARHARGLRRDMPGLPPRLLRLLRPDGDSQHRLAGGLVSRARQATSDIVRVFPLVQRRGRRSARRARRMSGA